MQHPEALEVVVVDGSSTDSTLDEVKDLANSVANVKFKCVVEYGQLAPGLWACVTRAAGALRMCQGVVKFLRPWWGSQQGRSSCGWAGPSVLARRYADAVRVRVRARGGYSHDCNVRAGVKNCVRVAARVT